MKGYYSNNIGLRVLITLPLAVVFLIIRTAEGRFGTWSFIAMLLTFFGASIALTIADKRRERRK